MNSVTMNCRASAVAAIAVVLLAGCASAPKARVDQDSRANFAGYKTYGWLEPKQADPAEAKAKVRTLSTQRVRTALSTALQSKGYTLDESRPDVRVSSVLNIYDRPKQSGMRIGLGAGGGSGNVGGGLGMSLPVGKRTETAGAMTIDVIDVSRNAQVWTGSYEMVMSGKDTTDADVQKMVDIILAKYPARPK